MLNVNIQWNGETGTVEIGNVSTPSNVENNTPVQSNRTDKVPIKILSVYGLPNSAGGAAPTILWRNDSGKTIKYATFTITPYNAVGDAVQSTIGGISTTQIKVTGPIAPFNSETDIAYSYFFYENSIPTIYTRNGMFYVQHHSGIEYYLTESDYENVFNIKSTWDPVWYNTTIQRYKISRVELEYMDGTKDSVDDPIIWHSIWWK